MLPLFVESSQLYFDQLKWNVDTNSMICQPIHEKVAKRTVQLDHIL